MDGASIQRFGILFVLFGGFLELSHVIQDTVTGFTTFGTPIMFLGLIIGLVDLTPGISFKEE